MTEQSFKEFFERIPADLKAKLAECKTQEEFVSLAEENGIELPEEELDGVSGGVWWRSIHEQSTSFKMQASGSLVCPIDY